ncbi:glycosyltransferase [Marinilactibacillus piezotolerans]|uniref:glycosyltransferase n=1 Tax=Marinilactibacillus piezotolerans TaxID=258723 RepID=UPI0009AF6B81|nr:glycosyltransferase [Marinilactibacillus piezotolerans]
MKIAFVNGNFELGGIQRVTTIIGKELSKKHEVYYYSMHSAENFYGIENNLINGETWLDKNLLLRKFVKSRRLLEQYLSSGEYTPSRYVTANLKKLINFSKKNNINCLILSGPDLTSFIPYIKRRAPELFLIAWQHNNANTYINDYAKSYKTAYLKGLTQANHVICLTDSDFTVYNNYANSISRIYNPLTIDNNKVSLLEDKIICFVGRVDIQHKGIDYLIEIASKLPKDWKISVAGSVDKHTKKKVEKLLTRFDAREKIIFRGPLNGLELHKHYFKSSFYLMTSRWEGFPLVIAEAMSFGLPVISFENTGSIEALGFGKYGKLVENGNIEKIMKEVISMINNDKIRKEYQNKSLKRVEEFSLKKVITQWEEVLSEAHLTTLT